VVSDWQLQTVGRLEIRVAKKSWKRYGSLEIESAVPIFLIQFKIGQIFETLSQPSRH